MLSIIICSVSPERLEQLAGAKVDSHMMPEEITSKLITDDEAKARRITDDYEKARYSNGEVSEEDISFLKNFK